MLVKDFTRSENELCKAEQTLRSLLLIPFIRERLQTFLMCLEMEEKVKEGEREREVLSKAFQVFIFYFLFIFFIYLFLFIIYFIIYFF